jgi:hypothetical protein
VLGKPVIVTVNLPPRVNVSPRDCSAVFTAETGITVTSEQRITARRIYPMCAPFMMATFLDAERVLDCLISVHG